MSKAPWIAGGLVGVVLIFSAASCVIGVAVDNADVIVDRYEEFYELCQRVQSTETAIIQAERAIELAHETGAPARELSYLMAEYRGAIGLRDRLATRYNSNARMLTRSWFRGNSLPESIALYAEGERTTCR